MYSIFIIPFLLETVVVYKKAKTGARFGGGRAESERDLSRIKTLHLKLGGGGGRTKRNYNIIRNILLLFGGLYHCYQTEDWLRKLVVPP